ncbi:NTP transferase domain-containing protein [Thalassobaculum sp. OXR-137]|uniref:NTP transferase domain-containing protein n=1 Tax=Thalassobaculum sp. OXR-137 TaxID=3100173 RepID=UPI002AC8D266|nr:NTP transferase domain-containing protein [Thalassobaculum sp. OXR-137]WPZ32316.1 NTP transferase domain-containing protein [Thalassobaculum sp. OXR-137]
MTASAQPTPLVVIPVLSAAPSTPRLLTPIRGRSSLWRTLDSAAADLPASPIVVTTDDDAIRNSVGQYGGRITAHARTARGYTQAVADVVEEYGAEIVVIVEPTHPFRPRGLIRRTAENLCARDHLDSVVCVRRFTANLWRRTSDGEILALDEGRDGQDAEYFQEMVGLALAVRASLIRKNRRLGDAVGFEVLEHAWALADVRDDQSFAAAEALADTLIRMEEIAR